MLDLMFVAIVGGFFALAIAYTYGCERLARGAADATDVRDQGGRHD